MEVTHLPEFFSGRGIKAGDEIAADHHELILAGDVVNHGGGIVVKLGAFDFPDFFSGETIQGDHSSFSLIVG